MCNCTGYRTSYLFAESNIEHSTFLVKVGSSDRPGKRGHSFQKAIGTYLNFQQSYISMNIKKVKKIKKLKFIHNGF